MLSITLTSTLTALDHNQLIISPLVSDSSYLDIYSTALLLGDHTAQLNSYAVSFYGYALSMRSCTAPWHLIGLHNVLCILICQSYSLLICIDQVLNLLYLKEY